jgi:hypothetical protein
LSYSEALQKAQGSVWRKFRIKDINLVTGKSPLVVPGYNGPIKRRQQLVLQNSKVEQLKPEPRFQGPEARNNPIKFAGQGAPAPYYDGYSNSRAAEVFTALGVWKSVGGQVIWPAAGSLNTPPGSKVFCDFTIDTFQQIVTFSDYVHYRQPGPSIGGAVSYTIQDPQLVIETAVLVKDADFGFLVRYEQALQLGGNAPNQWEIHDDVAVGIIAEYYKSEGSGSLKEYIGWKYGEGDLEDAQGRANYYLQGMAAKIQTPTADHRAPIGIYPLDLDGCVQQVSYEIGAAGPTTHWGLNTEYSVAIPPYPIRRRNENLPPNAAAVEANRREAEAAGLPFLDRNTGKPGL